MKDFGELVLPLILIALVAIAFYNISAVVQDGRHHRDLESVGIEKIIHHKTVVDGVCTTNWSEIIWMKNNH